MCPLPDTNRDSSSSVSDEIDLYFEQPYISPKTKRKLERPARETKREKEKYETAPPPQDIINHPPIPPDYISTGK